MYKSDIDYFKVSFVKMLCVNFYFFFLLFGSRGDNVEIIVFKMKVLGFLVTWSIVFFFYLAGGSCWIKRSYVGFNRYD